MAELLLPRRFPRRRAATALRNQLINHLVQVKPSPGTPFLSDADLVAKSKLSRSTVRRALDELQRDGWIDRRVGQGTFVGQRVTVPAPAQDDASGASPPGRVARSEHAGTPGARAATLRVAVLAFSVGEAGQDWYTPHVIHGLDSVADELNLSIELVGSHEFDLESIRRRLSRTQPDVLVGLTFEPRYALALRDAERLGTLCLTVGTPNANLGYPVVCEDNVQAMRLAVNHLAEHGHRRIALLQHPHVGQWVFDRLMTFQSAVAELGVPDVESLVHWLPVALTDRKAEVGASADAVRAYLEREGITAVIAGGWPATRVLDHLVSCRRIRVPDELSLVSIDQSLEGVTMLPGVSQALVQLPLYEMGQAIGRLVCDAAAGKPMPPMTALPCKLRAGTSVRSIGTGLTS